MILELEECQSFENHINIEVVIDEIDTHIGVKTEQYYKVDGFVSISLAEFKQAWFEACEEAMDWEGLEATLEISFKHIYNDETFDISDKYIIKKDRVIFFALN